MRPRHLTAAGIHDFINTALWAALAAATIYFVVMVIPAIPEARARWEARRIHEINEEYNYYCRNLGMGLGLPHHDECILNLQEFRTKVEQRIIAEDLP